MNEDILRKKWREVFENSDDYKQASMKARVAKRKSQEQANAARRAALSSGDLRAYSRMAEQPGMSDAEIVFDELSRAHDDEVRTFIDKARRRTSEDQARPGSTRAPGEHDFKDDQPWNNFRGKLAMSGAGLIENSKIGQPTLDRDTQNDRDIAEATARGDQIIPQSVQDVFNERAMEAAERIRRQGVEDAVMVKRTSDANMRRAQAIQDSRKTVMNPNESRLDLSGGTIHRGDELVAAVRPGRMYRGMVAPGQPTMPAQSMYAQNQQPSVPQPSFKWNASVLDAEDRTSLFPTIKPRAKNNFSRIVY